MIYIHVCELTVFFAGTLQHILVCYLLIRGIVYQIGV